MTIEQANQYFAALPDGFAPEEELRAALPAHAEKVAFVGVAGTAGKTMVAGLLAAILQAAGFPVGFYRAGCEPVERRIRIQGKPVDPGLLSNAVDALSAAKPLPRPAAELAVAVFCFAEAGCRLAVVEMADAGLAAAPPAERFIQRLAHRAHIPAGQAERIGEALPAGGQHRRQRVGAGRYRQTDPPQSVAVRTVTVQHSRLAGHGGLGQCFGQCVLHGGKALLEGSFRRLQVLHGGQQATGGGA